MSQSHTPCTAGALVTSAGEANGQPSSSSRRHLPRRLFHGRRTVRREQSTKGTRRRAQAPARAWPVFRGWISTDQDEISPSSCPWASPRRTPLPTADIGALWRGRRRVGSAAGADRIRSGGSDHSPSLDGSFPPAGFTFPASRGRTPAAWRPPLPRPRGRRLPARDGSPIPAGRPPTPVWRPSPP